MPQQAGDRLYSSLYGPLPFIVAAASVAVLHLKPDPPGSGVPCARGSFTASSSAAYPCSSAKGCRSSAHSHITSDSDMSRRSRIRAAWCRRNIR